MAYQLNISSSIVPSEEHQKRGQIRKESAEALYNSIESFDVKSLKGIYKELETLCLASAPLTSDPKWADYPFGAVNTVEKSGCLAFVSKVILDYFIKQDAPSMEDIIDTIVEGNYRSWILTNRSTKTLRMPRATVEGIKQEFPDDKDIQNCNSLDEIFAVAGEPYGIGGDMFFIDNLISSVSIDYKEKGTKQVTPYTDTRIKSVDQLLACLDKNCPVPLRVGNKSYLKDPKAIEGHYVILWGIITLRSDDDIATAVIIDSRARTTAPVIMPITQLFEAMTESKNLVCAWDTSCLSSLVD